MDIVERLRTPLGSSDSNFNYAYYNRMCHEAADEIERLREALFKIANGYSDEDGMRNIARQALGEKE